MPRVIHYFIPRESNNHKPFFTQHPGLATILIFAFAIQTSMNVFFSRRPQILGFATSIYKSELITLTNNERSNSGLQPLYHNPTLDDAARLKALHMFEHDYWAHVSPDGVDPWHWFETVGYTYSAAGENLARDFDTSTGVMAAWMASPGHRENILYPSFTEIGMAVVDGNLAGQETTLVVQLFGTPAATPPVVVEPVAIQPTPTAVPPTNTPVPVAVQPTTPPVVNTPLPTTTPDIPQPTDVPALTQPTPTPTAIPTPTNRPTPSPTPIFVLNNNSPSALTASTNVLNTPPKQFQLNLAVIGHLDSFSAGRLFSILLIGSLMLLLGSESMILWHKGIQHPHAHRIVHVGILFLTLLGTLYGAGGAIL